MIAVSSLTADHRALGLPAVLAFEEAARMASKDPLHQRRSPRQARSRATWEAIVEAAAQILERRGPSAFNTNEVAERAGVSIGTLYQYFPDKHAILIAAARRELGDAAPLAERQRALVRALIDMIERLGGGLAAQRIAAPAPVQRRRRRPSGWERAMADAWDLVAEWLAPAPPALRPIPIRRQRPQ
jgi:AcrR family transcriptional regulator